MNQNLLHQLFEYKDGDLYWKVDRRTATAGSLACTKRPDGYFRVRIDGKRYFAHRLIFLMQYGYLPKFIDHIDGNPSNNHLSNLREATHEQNLRNMKTPKTNTSGVKGVHWHKTNRKWIVTIRLNKKTTYVGSFEDLELARLASIAVRNKYYGEFARHE